MSLASTEADTSKRRCSGMRLPLQGRLFETSPDPSWPAGFLYREEVIHADDEARLISEVRRLPFREFQFHGFEGKRRVVSFGWRYDFNEEKAIPAPYTAGDDALRRVNAR